MPCHATHRFDQVGRQVGEDEAGEDEEHHLGQPLLSLLQPLRESHVGVPDLVFHLLPDANDLKGVDTINGASLINQEKYKKYSLIVQELS